MGVLEWVEEALDGLIDGRVDGRVGESVEWVDRRVG
jgi:hypothetical protein